MRKTQVVAAVDCQLVREILPDADVPENTVVPPKWNLNAAGISAVSRETAVISAINHDAEVLIPAPIVITRRLIDVQSKAESLELAWRKDNHWQSKIVPRAMVASARSIVELAAFGLPVTSNNAAELVQFLADFEALNLEILPNARTTEQLGWQGDEGRDGFLLGRQFVTATPSGSQPYRYDLPSATGSSNIVFRGADDGDDQLVDGYHESGTFDGWREVIRPLAAFPRVRLAMYAAPHRCCASDF